MVHYIQTEKGEEQVSIIGYKFEKSILAIVRRQNGKIEYLSVSKIKEKK